MLPFAAVLHVLEEWAGGFVVQMSRFVPGVTATHFWLINAVFVALCLVAAVVHGRYPVLSLAAIALVGINSLIHVVASVALRAYSPGLISAIVLYVPLTSWTFYRALAQREITSVQARRAALLGLAFMAVPLIFQGLRLTLAIQSGHSSICGPKPSYADNSVFLVGHVFQYRASMRGRCVPVPMG